MKIKKLIFSVLFLFTFFLSSLAQYNYGDALEKGIWFFDANKCGHQVSDNNVFSWRGPCHLSDGTNGHDLTGGFHDAGDHVKFGLPQCWSAATLGFALYEFRSSFDDAGVTPKLLSTLKYFTDYFLKCHPDPNTFYYNIGDGGADHGYWGSPEAQSGDRPVIAATPSKPASDVCSQAAAALSLMYLNYQDVDLRYANQCLDAAKSIYALGVTYKGRSDDGGGGQFYKSSSHFEDLSWGAIWLSIATGDNSYLAPVDGWLDIRNDYGDDNYAKPWAPAWDDVTVFALLKMYDLTGIEKYKQGVINNLEWARDVCNKTPYGLPYVDVWGALRYASAEAGLGYLANKILGYDGYVSTADLSMNYALGTNPRNSSYVTGWGNNPPVHPHHRANEPDFYHPHSGNTNGIIGGLVGGPDRNDGYNDDIADFERSELGIDYNASFILGLSGKIYNDGGNTSDKLIVSQSSVSCTSAPELKTVNISSNIAWNVTNTLSWVSISPLSGSGNGAIELNVSSNTSTSSRSGQITVSGGEITRAISVTQSGINNEEPNIALNKPVTASSTEAEYGNVAANAVDGDPATRWSSEYSDPQWITVDLENTYDISEIIISWEAASASSYTIEVSNNGSSWTTASTKSNMPAGPRTDNIAVNTTGRYVKVNITGRNTEWGASIFELEIKGTPANPVAVTGVSLNPASAELNVGSNQQLNPIIVPANATNTNVTYSSSNPLVATVSSSGLVTGLKAGNATITVTTQDGSFTSSSLITVNQQEISGGFTISGNELLDANGNEFIMRGINMPFRWYYGYCMDNLETIKNNTNSNSMRIVWDTSGDDSEMQAAIQKCIDLKMIPMIELHDVTCSNDVSGLLRMAQWFADRADYFKRPEIAKYIIINIANEWGDWYMGTQAWVDGNKQAISIIRNSGIETTLVIDGPDCGKNMEVISDGGASLLSHDAAYLNGNANLMMGVHFYCRYTNANDIESGLNNLLNKGMSVFIGEFGQEHPDGNGGNCDIPEADIIRVAQQRGIGYMPWSWKGNNAEVAMLDMSNDWAGNSLTNWGDYIVNSSNGIKNTSVIASVFNNDPVRVTGVSLLPKNITIGINQNSQLNPTVIPTNASNQNVTYSSNNTSVATVSQSGSVSGISQGTATIKVTTQDGSFEDNCIVTVLPTLENLALNKPVFVSSTEAEYGNIASNAVDGNSTSRWSSEYSDPQWIYVDLQNNYTINNVIIKWEDASAKEYEIQVSDNANTWNSVYATSNGDGGNDEISINAQGRYVRVFCNQRNTEWGNSLWEVEVYGQLNDGIIANAGNDINKTDNDENGEECFTLDAGGSLGDITNYSWILDGQLVGSTPTLQLCRPVGNYTAVLEVSNNEGESDRDSCQIVIRDKTPINGYPFGILPSIANQADAQSAYITFMDLFFEDCNDGKGRIKWGLPENGWEIPGQTVSEGIAYGMLYAAYFNDQEKFDKLWAYYNAFPDANGLMHWKTSGCNGVVQQNAATDAEVDAAMALIVADKKWGGYENDAKWLIGKIKQHEVESGTNVLKPGDVFGGSARTNISYFAPGYFKIFGEYTNDISFWNGVVDKCYEIIDNNLNTKNAVGGLVSDWCSADGASSGGDERYFYDACRTPWRISMDYVWFGDARAKSYLDKTNNFVASIGGITEVMDGYNPDGTLLAGTRYHNTTFVSTFACAGVAFDNVSDADTYYAEIAVPDVVSYFDYCFDLFSRTLLSGIFQNPINIDPDKVSLNVNIIGGGNVELTPAGGVYDIGTVVIAEAIGDNFEAWSGAANGTARTVSITMDANKSLTAAFQSSGGCDNPIATNLPFEHNGNTGEHCWVVTGDLSIINSWAAEKVEINGVDITNIWVNSFPERIDGNYYIYFKGLEPWGHIEVTGTNKSAFAEKKSVINVMKSNFDNVKVFPNPVGKDDLKVLVPDNLINSTARILDLTGREIYKTQIISTETIISRDLFKKGIYILELRNKEEMKNIKLIAE